VVAQGVRVLKVEVGRDWAEDVARIRDLQEGLGPQVMLYADANETMEPATAASRLALLGEMGVLAPRRTAAGRAGAGVSGAARPRAAAGHCRRQCVQPTRSAA
jgi:hypothetical protein